MKSTKQKVTRRNHALRNEEACLFLEKTGKYQDWVITMAFYSALNFVKHKVFPFSEGGKTFSTLDKYREYRRKFCKHGTSSHSVLKKLLNRKFKKIALPYRELYETCETARYHNYNVTPEEVIYALENLKEIKKYCNTNKPAKAK